MRGTLHRIFTHLRRWLGISGRKTPKIFPRIAQEDKEFRGMAFTYAVIALSAKVACCNGTLTREKYMAFRESFPLSGGICNTIRSLFTLACENPAPFEHYVTQIKYAFPDRQELFSSLVDRLFRIAASDGSPSPEAEHLLAATARILEMPPGAYGKIRARYHQSGEDSQEMAEHILGVTPNVKAGTLKKRYRELLQRYHPDRYAGKLSPEVESLLQLKTSEINAAYKKLSKRAA